MEHPARYRDALVGPNLPCLASCDDEIYGVTMSSAAYPSRGTLLRRYELCHVIAKILAICAGANSTDYVLSLKKEELEARYPNLCPSLTRQADGDKSCEENIAAIKYLEDVKEELYEYSRTNLAWVNVYFSQTFSRKLVRDEKYTLTGFIANIGGLMGLCMGFSLVSLVEFVFFCFFRSSRN